MELFILKEDRAPDLNEGGAAKRREVWRSSRATCHYVGIPQNAFTADSLVWYYGKNLGANYDMGVRSRIRELIFANNTATSD